MILYNLPEGYIGFEPFVYNLPGRLYTNYWLSPLGFPSGDFASADFYPLIPYTLLFLSFAIMTKNIREKKLPKFFYRGIIPFLQPVGRNSLWIYLFHQPVLFALFYLFFDLMKLG